MFGYIYFRQSNQAAKSRVKVLAASCNGGNMLPATAIGGMTSATFPASFPPLPASHVGGTRVFPPLPMAGSTFRQSKWRFLLSANACGGNSHVSPFGAPARPEMTIFFGGGHF
jgi:hypothetical protein